MHVLQLWLAAWFIETGDGLVLGSFGFNGDLSKSVYMVISTNVLVSTFPLILNIFVIEVPISSWSTISTASNKLEWLLRLWYTFYIYRARIAKRSLYTADQQINTTQSSGHLRNRFVGKHLCFQEVTACAMHHSTGCVASCIEAWSVTLEEHHGKEHHLVLLPSMLVRYILFICPRNGVHISRSTKLFLGRLRCLWATPFFDYSASLTRRMWKTQRSTAARVICEDR